MWRPCSGVEVLPVCPALYSAPLSTASKCVCLCVHACVVLAGLQEGTELQGRRKGAWFSVSVVSSYCVRCGEKDLLRQVLCTLSVTNGCVTVNKNLLISVLNRHGRGEASLF